MTLVGWLDTDDVSARWSDASQMEDAELADYLESAYEQCVIYLGPDVDVEPDIVPARWRLAQLMQARALFRSDVAGSGDRIGADGLMVTVFPMDWTVKNLLKPKRLAFVQ